jgi:hypothetical protein
MGTTKKKKERKGMSISVLCCAKKMGAQNQG